VMGKDLVIVDYQAGNLRSVARALEAAGARPSITSDPEEVRQARAVVFPGQGACDSAMAALEASELTAAVKEFIQSGRPSWGCVSACSSSWTTPRKGTCPALASSPVGCAGCRRG
jgi:imidazoleglycerol phosphate synthase glutamine amidotransferase subunit HisH